MNTQANENFKFQRIIAIVGIILFLVKLYAWYQTNSVAILTDALESTINVIAGLIGLYSLYLSSLPKDHNHPYGHGKVEFISASIEGILISAAGVVIVYEAIGELQNPKTIEKLDLGLILVSLTAVINYVLGFFAIQKGKKNNCKWQTFTNRHVFYHWNHHWISYFVLYSNFLD